MTVRDDGRWFLKYFGWSFLTAFVGLLFAFVIGFHFEGSLKAAGETVLLCFVLSILEVSLSFDNAVVNATVLQRMTDLWRHRFLTWGILIAVFGMRLVFPLAIVGFLAHLNPWDALVMAATQPDRYAELMHEAHVPVAGFGGAFLLMVALKYFFDSSRERYWIRVIEVPLAKLGHLEMIELAIAIVGLYLIARGLEPSRAWTFLVAGLCGLVTFILVDGLGTLLEKSGAQAAADNVHRASIGMFLYLEVLDASFSFDGVVGAFAITNNLFIIAIGLGIGAMFVRSLTILLVDRGTLTEYIYLEHGAFYAIFALAALMFLGVYINVSDFITGLIGAAFIALSFWSSLRHNKLDHREEFHIGK